MDEAVAEKNLKEFKKKIKKVSLLPISAAFDQGMEKFRDTIRKEVEEATKRLHEKCAQYNFKA
jgi:GTPase Era involved in 16S rRNA processing